MVWRGHAFPHSTKPDLFLLFDRLRHRPVPFPSDFRCFGQGAEGIFSAAQLEKIAHRKGRADIDRGEPQEEHKSAKVFLT